MPTPKELPARPVPSSSPPVPVGAVSNHCSPAVDRGLGPRRSKSAVSQTTRTVHRGLEQPNVVVSVAPSAPLLNATEAAGHRSSAGPFQPNYGVACRARINVRIRVRGRIAGDFPGRSSGHSFCARV